VSSSQMQDTVRAIAYEMVKEQRPHTRLHMALESLIIALKTDSFTLEKIRAMPNRRRRMLAICARMAPNEKVRDGFLSLFLTMESAEEQDSDIVMALCQALLDGHNNGNWPNS